MNSFVTGFSTIFKWNVASSDHCAFVGLSKKEGIDILEKASFFTTKESTQANCEANHVSSSHSFGYQNGFFPLHSLQHKSLKIVCYVAGFIYSVSNMNYICWICLGNICRKNHVQSHKKGHISRSTRNLIRYTSRARLTRQTSSSNPHFQSVTRRVTYA